MKKALITGVTGQDGSYLAELLLSKEYEVHGIVRRSSTITRERIDHLKTDPNFHLHYGDLADADSLFSIVKIVQPDEVYNLAAQSHVGVSFMVPELTVDVTGTGTLRLLEAIRLNGLCDKTKFYQASSSEMFGKCDPINGIFQDETTPFNPQSPYACAKVMAHHLVKHYREAYGMFASCGILFNHESPRRGENFVTRKIAIGVVKIKFGMSQDITLGNLEARRDWGYAPEYVEGMWKIMQCKYPNDFVLATGVSTSVKEFLAMAFQAAGINEWSHLVNPNCSKYGRPSDVGWLRGCSTKAGVAFDWKPRTCVAQLAEIMVDAEIARLSK